jgi:hypothetical protein
MTEDRPLLAFAPPVEGPIPPVTTRPPYRPVTRPGAGRQGERLSPQFEELQSALLHRRAELSDVPGATDPELVVVFDLAGSVDRFFRAVSYVPGLEFLAEKEEELVEPDEDFYYMEDGEASDAGVPRSLYMAMSNERAVTELVRLFELWQDDQSITFDRGLAPLKDVFALLRSVRRWSPVDRVRETGLLEDWAEDLQVIGSQGFARVEIELWFRSEQERRTALLRDVSEIVLRHGGRVITSSQLSDISYHGVLADLPYAEVEQVLNDGPDAIELLCAEYIMFVSPSKPMHFPRLTADFMQQDRLPVAGAAPQGPPRIGLLDGLPMANHIALRNRLIIDDPDDHALRYPVARQCHGTAMASLISHGDLSVPGTPSSSKIYVRPILKPHEILEEETFPPDELLVDLIHRSFQRMFEDVGDRIAAAPSIRIVNLSIGDPVRQFVRTLSPLAKLVDWLAYRYNLVVIVSAGNHDALLEHIPSELVEDASSLRDHVLKRLHERSMSRRLLSPAEAVNAITVGALHIDGASAAPVPDTVLDVIPEGLPASYSSVGFGYRRSVKPEVLLPGGRMLYQRPVVDSSEPGVALHPSSTTAHGPGILVAAPGLSGEVDGTCFTQGTSNSAALATRAVNEIFDTLESLAAESGEFPFPTAEYHPVLAKALLVHAAGWHDLGPQLVAALNIPVPRSRRLLTRILGYGSVSPDRIATASRNRVVLLGAGSIRKDKRHSYRFPLPTSLAASTEQRRLAITLAWLSPTNARSQKYRVARLFFSPPREELGCALAEADHNAVEKGTIRHQVANGQSAVAFAAGDSLAIDVDCRVDTGSLAVPVRYALVASIEISASIQVDIHEEVRQQLRAQVLDRVRGRVTARTMT